MKIKRYLPIISSAIILAVASTASLQAPALAENPTKHSSRQASADQAPVQASDSEDYSSDEDEATSGRSSDEEAQSTAESESESQPISLLNVVTNMFLIGLGVVSLLCVVAVAHIIPGALVWHGGNILRGGKRPEVG